MRMFRSLPMVALLGLLLGAWGFSACKKEEVVAKDPPKKRALPVEEEPTVDPIDPQRIEQAMKISVEPETPEMAEKPEEPAHDDMATDSKAGMEEEADEDAEDGMAAKEKSPSMKHVH